MLMVALFSKSAVLKVEMPNIKKKKIIIITNKIKILIFIY